MATRFFTDFSGNSSTFIAIPSYSGEITLEVYPRANNNGIPGAPSLTLWRWNTVTVNVSNLTEIGRSFNGLIANISGDGFNIPVALVSGIESPATLNGSGYSQFECEEVNPPYNDWARTLNLFTPGSHIIEPTDTGFPLALNNLNNTGRRYYANVLFEAVDGAGDPTGDQVPTGTINYKLDGSVASQFDNGRYGIGPAFYHTSTSASHYLQVLSTPVRTRVTARTSEVFEYVRPQDDWLFIFGNGQSLSVGTSSGVTDSDHLLPIREGVTHLTYGNKRSARTGDFISNYRNLRYYSEEYAVSTHVYSMLSELESRDFPANAHSITANEGKAGQNIDAAAAYGPNNATTALTAFAENENIDVGDENAVLVWIHGEANSGDFATYNAKLRAMHDDYIGQINAMRPAISAVPMVLDQTGGAPTYWGVANETFKYFRDNADAHLATPKYHINSQYPAVAGGDVIHLNAIGYDYQGEYHGRAINDVVYGAGEFSPCYPVKAYPAGNTVVIEVNVPSPPLVKDAATVPQAVADGIAYRINGGGTITPLSQTIDGNKIIIDIGLAPVIGDSVEFGNNNTAKAGVGNFPITNFRDSSPDVGAITGLPLHNWMVLSSVVIEAAPADDELILDATVGVDALFTLGSLSLVNDALVFDGAAGVSSTLELDSVSLVNDAITFNVGIGAASELLLGELILVNDQLPLSINIGLSAQFQLTDSTPVNDVINLTADFGASGTLALGDTALTNDVINLAGAIALDANLLLASITRVDDLLNFNSAIALGSELLLGPNDGLLDAFNLGGPKSAGEPDTIYNAAIFTITGAVPGVDLIVVPTNGEVAINNGEYTASPTTARNGDTVKFRIKSSPDFATEVIGTLAINEVTDTFAVTTREAPLFVRGPFDPFDTRLIEERLSEAQFGFEKVTGAADYAAIENIGTCREGTVYVVLARELNGLNQAPQARNKHTATVTFGVICVTRSYRDVRGKDAQKSMSKVVGKARQAIVGWVPEGCTPCVWLQGDVLDYDKTNLLWIDVYSTTHVLGGAA